MRAPVFILALSLSAALTAPAIAGEPLPAAPITLAQNAGTSMPALQPRPGTTRLLGIVEGGRFAALGDTGPLPAQVRLTAIQRQAAMSPDAGELDLSAYEGAAVMVEGFLDSGWLYEAAVVDSAGPILTDLVRRSYAD
ncbi:MAG: hypothetical protein KDJ16_10920 [Hyphomicrobiales bacterium]|nr:hypothetical protein [Hyphomicrobiales bacterium]